MSTSSDNSVLTIAERVGLLPFLQTTIAQQRLIDFADVFLAERDKAIAREEEKRNPADMVNNPPHYNAGSVECIEAIRSALTAEEFRGYCKGNALKYVWREKHKGQDESLQKAIWYLSKTQE